MVSLTCHGPEDGVGPSSKDPKKGGELPATPPLFSLMGTVPLLTSRGARGGLGLIFRMSWLSTCSMTVQPSLVALNVITKGDHTRMQQFAGSESMIKGQISKAHTAGQFGELIRKRHGMSASGAGTSSWDIPCPKRAKSIGLACSLLLPYFFLVQWASGLHADLASMEKFMNSSLPHPSQSRIAWSLVVRHLPRK